MRGARALPLVRRPLGVLGLALALALPPATPAQAGWDGFYAPATPIVRSVPAAVARAPGDGALGGNGGEGWARGACVREILLAQLRHNIPDNILLGIGLQEAGTRREGELTVWPWAVNAAGEGRLFNNGVAAAGWVRERLAQGTESIDVGCLQINLRWHPDAFARLEDGFDPRRNVDYAARFLKGLYEKTGDWRLAAGSYHSFTPEKREIYLASLERNVAVANERIAGFRALANTQGGGDFAPDRRPEMMAERAPELPPDTGPLWSAHLSGGRRGIYSRADIQPVLPVFQPAS